jgi:PAS domain S-box-containing protein
MQGSLREYQRLYSFDRGDEEEHLARYGYLEENALEVLIATDKQLVVKAWNRGAERMYRVWAEEALGRDAREVMSLEMSDEQLAEAFQEISDTGRLRVEQLHYYKDGTPIYVDALIIALHDEQGQTTG